MCVTAMFNSLYNQIWLHIILCPEHVLQNLLVQLLTLLVLSYLTLKLLVTDWLFHSALSAIRASDTFKCIVVTARPAAPKRLRALG